MTIKTIILAVSISVLFVSTSTTDVDCSTGGIDVCEPTEKCEENVCKDRDNCQETTDCSSHGTCEEDKSCKCDPEYTGNDCSKLQCGSSTTCTLPQVCVGPSGSETCVDDPCEGTPCGDNGECSYDKTVTNPSFVCTCKNGYGGTTCTDEPECTKSEDCTDDAKPECKKEEGKQSVCAEKTNGGNNVAATPGILLAVLLAAFYL